MILAAAIGCADLGTPLAPGCELSTTSLSFGAILVGQHVDLDVVIRSTGAVDLPVHVASPCAEFQVLTGAGPARIPPGGARNVTVRYIPSALGVDACVLSLGPHCPTVSLAGEAIPPGVGPQCSFSPGSLDFGPVAIGQFAERSFTIHSVGSDDLVVDVSSPCPAFAIVAGAGSGVLTPGGLRVVTVRFAPLETGPAGCTIALGTVCAGVPVSGSGQLPTTVSFANDIQPIFNARCVSCHPNEGELSLLPSVSYDNLVDVESFSYAPAVRIAPGDTNASVLYNKVKGLQAYGQRMPEPPDPALTVDERLKLRAWILEGARRN